MTAFQRWNRVHQGHWVTGSAILAWLGQTRCLAHFELTCELIAALFLQSNTISAN